MTLGHVIDAFATEDIRVIRPSGGVYGPDGRAMWTHSTAYVDVRAVVHPATGRDTELLPEGTRIDETICIYTREPLRSISEKSLADIVKWGRTTYEVMRVFDRTAEGGHCKTLAVRRVATG